MKKKKKTNKGIVLIKKSNNLIESRYKFDIWETRFFLSVLSQIRRDDEDFHSYRIWYRDVIKTFGLKSGDSYALLRTAAQSLMGKSFFVSYEKEGATREQQYHILRKIDYLQEGQRQTQENQEYIDVTVEQEMRPFLLELQKNFTTYDLQNIIKLNVYPVRVYELLKQYESIGHRKLKVEEMKIMFEVSDKYKAFGDFYRWVVKPAIKEINKHTDLTITDVEKIKEGRRVTSLMFRFKAKRQKELAEARGEVKDYKHTKPDNIAHDVSDKDRIFELFHNDVVKRFGVTPSSFLRLLDDYNEEQIAQAVRVTNRAKYNQQIKSNTAGYFVQALKEGYTDEKEEADRKKMEQNAAKQSEEEKKKRLQQLKREKSTKINQRIKELVSKKPDITDKAIADLRDSPLVKVVIDQKEEKLGRSLEVEDFRKDKMLREMVKSKIVESEKAFFKDILEEYK